MKTTKRPTLLEAMAEIENGRKWWTLKEITRLLKDLGWIGSRADQMRKADIIPLIALALGNHQLESRYSNDAGENEFRLCRSK